MKPSMTSVQEIKGYEGQGRCLTETSGMVNGTGTLKLTMNVNGQAANMAVYMHEAETHQWLAVSTKTFGKKPTFYFKSSSIKLPEILTGKC